MPAPLSMDLRRRIVEAVADGSSIRAAARRFAVSPSAAIKLMQRVRATGSAAPDRYGGHGRPVLEPHGDAHAPGGGRAGPDPGGVAGAGAGPLRSGGRPVDAARRPAPAWPAAQKKSLRAAEQDRPDVAAKRRRWHGWQGYMEPARFVFLDETSAATNMARRYGRSPAAERLVASAPHGHWRTPTFVAGLRLSGVTAPLVLDRSGAGLPVARTRCISLIAADGLTANRRATARIELPPATASTIRRRRSSDKGAGITTTP